MPYPNRPANFNLSSLLESKKALELIDSLGVKATGKWTTVETKTGGTAWIYFLYFDNEEDMNLYKLTSNKFLENCVLKKG